MAVETDAAMHRFTLDAPQTVSARWEALSSPSLRAHQAW